MTNTIRNLSEQDIATIVSAFSEIGWDKPYSLFQGYLEEQRRGQRFVWVAFDSNQFLGYVTLKLHSEYPLFKQQNIPEINDFNVLPPYRNRGVGSSLLNVAEEKAKDFNKKIGIGVGLYPDYGAAQRLYVKRGYIPDGQGVTYQYQAVIPGHDYKVDDELILWFIKTF